MKIQINTGNAVLSNVLGLHWWLPCQWLVLNFEGNLLSACISGLITSVTLHDLFFCSLLSLISSLGLYHKTGSPFFPLQRLWVRMSLDNVRSGRELSLLFYTKRRRKGKFWDSHAWTEQLLKPAYTAFLMLSYYVYSWWYNRSKTFRL